MSEPPLLRRPFQHELLLLMHRPMFRLDRAIIWTCCLTVVVTDPPQLRGMRRLQISLIRILLRLRLRGDPCWILGHRLRRPVRRFTMTFWACRRLLNIHRMEETIHHRNSHNHRHRNSNQCISNSSNKNRQVVNRSIVSRNRHNPLAIWVGGRRLSILNLLLY